MSSVYIAIPCLDDVEIAPTVINAFESASNPDEIFVGIWMYSSKLVRDKFLKDTKKYSKNIRFEFTELTEKNFEENIGVGKGRVKAMSFYKNEDYALQVDSHSKFEKNWDTDLIALLKEAKEFVKNDKTILTAYAGHYGYNYKGDRVWIDFSQKQNFHLDPRLLYPIIDGLTIFYGAIPSWRNIKAADNIVFDKKFVPAVKFNANFAFGDSEWAKNTGVFEDSFFFEEELSQTINLIDLGYTLVYPNISKPIIGHLYSDITSRTYGFRTSVMDYEMYDARKWQNLAEKNYNEFMARPEKAKAIQEYKKYARIHMKYGPIDNDIHIPKYFLNSEVKYEH